MMKQEILLKRISKLTNTYKAPENASKPFQKLCKKLEEFEGNLNKHVHLENNILFPKAKKLELKSSRILKYFNFHFSLVLSKFLFIIFAKNLKYLEKNISFLCTHHFCMQFLLHKKEEKLNIVNAEQQEADEEKNPWSNNATFGKS